jgi:hypothetical protein
VHNCIPLEYNKQDEIEELVPAVLVKRLVNKRLLQSSIEGLFMEWIVDLSGDTSDLDELSKVFTSPDLCIQKDGEKFQLKSTNFNLCESSNDVKKNASEILCLLTAGIKMSLDARKKLDIDSILQVGDDGLKHYFVEASITVSSRCSGSGEIIHQDGTKEYFHQADPIPQWIKIAQTDAKVEKAFQFISADFNSWYTLYKILEVLEEDHFNPIMRGGHYKKMVDNFTHTADCYKTIGLDARHAKEIKTPPTNPMSLSEAKSFIKMLLHEWLREKESKL